MNGDDFVAFREGDKWGFQTKDGQIAIAPTFDSVGTFSEGLARVRKAKLWGFIKVDGSFGIELRFEQARHFSGGYAKVKEEGRWGLIDVKGFWVENVESQSYMDDQGRFISKDDHKAWEKPPGQDEDREGK